MLKNAPNQADNIAIFQSCLLPKMRLSVVLEGRYTGYKSPTFCLRLGRTSVVACWWRQLAQQSYRTGHHDRPSETKTKEDCN